MRILKFEVEGYKSFRTTKLDKLGKLVVLIGRNGSGKSNLTELVEFFFRDLDALPQKALGPINEHYWHGFDPKEPVNVSAEIEVDGDALGRLLPKEFGFSATGPVTISISRFLEKSGANMEWKTRHLTIGERSVVEEGAVAQPGDLLPATEPAPAPTDGASAPGPSTAAAAAPADLPQKVLQAISQALLARFQVIPAARSRPASTGPANQRLSVLDDQIMNQVQTMAQLVNPRERRRTFKPLQQSLKSILPTISNLSAPQGQPFVFEGNLEVPLALTGGGVQEVINLLVRIQTAVQAKDGSVVAIEEPETHLHPDAMKLLLRFLARDDSVSQVWMTTHSPFLVDRTDLSNVWLVSKEDGVSEIVRLSDTESLRRAFRELGVRPSDVLYGDAIILVEGESDVEFYRGMALKMDFHEIEFASVIPTGGVPKDRHHLEMWSDISRKTQLPVFLLLDLDAKAEVKDAVTRKQVDPRRAFHLERGSLEDLYPRDKLAGALKEVFGIEVEVEKLVSPGTSKVLETELLRAQVDKHQWKKRLAIAMLERVTADEAPEALRTLLHSLRAELAG